ncbi:MAG: hypothetical protein QOE70_1680 [Chthoniobacter sp.]|nr:hypothetical protein [Chthoniobacter sp.]
MVLRRSKSSVRIFDTKTWERRESAPRVPAEVVAWVPSAKVPRAIIEASGNRIALWDSEKSREVALLDRDARLERVAFSPDQTRVAVATVHQADGGYWTNCRLRVWRVADGGLVSELRPYEYDRPETIKSVLWTADGRYVLAPVTGRAFGPPAIKIWNVATSRHRGSLVGSGKMFGAEILAGEKRIVASAQDGKMCVWDLAGALRQVRELERSVEGSAEPQ